MINSIKGCGKHQTDTACAWLVCHSQEGLCKLYPTYPASQEARAPSFFLEASHATPQLRSGESKPGPKPTLKSLLHTLTKYTNSPVQPSQSSSLSPAHSPPNSPTSVQSLLQNTPTYHRASIQLHTLIYLKQHTGPLDVSREGGASASQVERTPGRATLTSWVVGPLHSYTQEGWVDNNNKCCRKVKGYKNSTLAGIKAAKYVVVNFHKDCFC